MEGLTLRIVTGFDELRPLLRMRSEHVDLKFDGKTTYLGAFVGGKIVGCVGWMKIGRNLRYKSDCVLPEHRGKGIYGKLWEDREFLTENQSTITTAFCTSLSVGMYLAKGFKKVSKNSKGIYFVKRMIR